MKGIIRLGDSHSHNGEVNSASGPIFAGKPVMLIGDTVNCSRHGKVTVEQGHASWTMHGKAVVVDGCAASCGCILQSSLTSVGVKP
ncbi:MAG: PAAR domain-containing protein [Rouxiella aceris]|uniref:PAAR domain-containing protein n=1 Tax=Rouxiella aceris TaxID=2703884 RepID=UPI00284276D0|nr:PAAR domain-containing protein [Rouxiella aceris]MDR3434206.1 PAAR domain-containing protein [Rouxiella aceris]